MSRITPFGDLSEFVPTAQAKPVTDAQIEQIASAENFPSRQPAAAPGKVPRRRRYPITGRDRQLNMKVTAETLKRYYDLADELGLPLGALVERLLDDREKAAQSAQKPT